MPQLPGLPPPGFASAGAAPQGLPGLPPPGFAGKGGGDSSFMGDLPAIGERLLQGTADLGSFVEGINPFQPGGPKYAQQLANYISGSDNNLPPSIGDQGVQQFRNIGLVGDKPREANTVPGKIAGEVAYYLPGAIIPGGSVGGRVASTLGAGLAAGTGKAAGASEEAQALLGLAGSFAPAALSGVSNLTGAIGNDLERRALSIGKADLKKADKFTPTVTKTINADKTRSYSVEDSKLIKGLTGVKERGLLDGSRSPAAIISRNEKAIDDLGDQVTLVLRSGDQIQPAQAPQFQHAQKFVKDNMWEMDTLGDQLQKRLSVFAKEWDGSLSGLQRAKQKLYKIGYKGNTDSKALDQAIARDLKEAIENGATAALGEDAGARVKLLNAQQGEHLTLRDLFEKNRYADEAPGSILKSLFGGAAGLAGGAAIGANPAALAAGAIGAGLTTRPGQFIAGNLFQGASKLAGKAGGTGGAVTATAITRALQNIDNANKEGPEQKTKQLRLSATPSTQGSPVSTALSMLTQQENPLKSAQQSPTSSIAKVLSNLGVQDAEASINTNVPKNMSKSTSELEPLLKAVKSVESAGNRLAVSNKGAKGAYQLMDATGREYHRRLGLKEKYDPFNESQAKVLAEAFLSDLKARYADDRIAIAAYNLGETRMNNAIKMRGLTAKTARWEDIYQLLPNETREYAPKVVSRIA